MGHVIWLDTRPRIFVHIGACCSDTAYAGGVVQVSVSSGPDVVLNRAGSEPSLLWTLLVSTFMPFFSVGSDPLLLILSHLEFPFHPSNVLPFSIRLMSVHLASITLALHWQGSLVYNTRLKGLGMNKPIHSLPPLISLSSSLYSLSLSPSQPSLYSTLIFLSTFVKVHLIGSPRRQQAEISIKH